MAHAHCMLDNYGCKYTHSGCVILIALPLQQWLHERASLLRCTYISCYKPRRSVYCAVRTELLNTTEVRFGLLSFNTCLRWEKGHKRAQYIPGSCIRTALNEAPHSCSETQWHTMAHSTHAYVHMCTAVMPMVLMWFLAPQVINSHSRAEFDWISPFERYASKSEL